jgi:hypothetical protein
LGVSPPPAYAYTTRRRVSLEATPTSEESDMGEENAADKERAMREHEREARERDPDERSPEGERGGRDGSVVEPAPPGNVQEGTSTGS